MQENNLAREENISTDANFQLLDSIYMFKLVYVN